MNRKFLTSVTTAILLLSPAVHAKTTVAKATKPKADPCIVHPTNSKCLLKQLNAVTITVANLQDQLKALQSQGTTGPQGPQGVQGPKGDQGVQGPPGLPSLTTDASLKGAGSAASPLGLSGFGKNTNTAKEQGNLGAVSLFLGTVMLSASPLAGGLPCNGQLLQISQNTALFSLLGTTYGGDGVTTFAVPDLRGQAPNGLTYYILISGIFPAL